MKKILVLCLSALFLIIIQVLPVSASEMIKLKNVEQKDVSDYIVSNSLESGFTIKSTSQYSIVTEDNKSKDIKFKLNWGTNAKILHVYNFVQSGPDLMLSYEIQIVSNPGSPEEKIHVASKENAKGYFPSNKEYLEYGDKITKQYLQILKKYFNGAYLYGLDIELKHKELIITSVSPNSPVSIAGIVVGEKITKLNGLDIKNMDIDAINSLFTIGDEGAKITLSIIRNGKEIPIELTKQFYPPIFKK